MNVRGRGMQLADAEGSITCNVICPGWVWTSLIERQIQEIADAKQVGLCSSPFHLADCIAAAVDGGGHGGAAAREGAVQAVHHPARHRRCLRVPVQRGGRQPHRRRAGHGRRVDRRLAPKGIRPPPPNKGGSWPPSPPLHLQCMPRAAHTHAYTHTHTRSHDRRRRDCGRPGGWRRCRCRR